MTKNQAQQRSEKAENLKVFQAEGNNYYCESSEGKICYKVSFGEEHVECTCGDYARNRKTEPNFRCKHILAVFNAIPTGSAEAVTFLKKNMPKLDDRFIMTIEGREFVKYPGLLSLGHQRGLAGIEVEILQIPTEENGKFAICKATVTSKTGDIFTDIGDANPLNCSSKIVKHLLRFSATRAIARALRSYTNIGMTCLEELDGAEDLKGDINGENGSRGRKPPVRVVPDKPAPTATESQAQNTVSGTQATNAAPGTKAETGQEKPVEQNEKPPATKPRAVESKKGPAQKTESKPATAQPPGNEPENKRIEMSEAQSRAIANLSRRRGISVEALEKLSIETFNVSVKHLSSQEASSFIRQLQQAA